MQTIRASVLLLPNASNIDDFKPLATEVGVDLEMVRMGRQLKDPDLLIIPGTRTTISDYLYIKKKGYVHQIKKLYKTGCFVMGISGGFQMLGTKIIDIKGSEYGRPQSDGIGLLNMVTRLMPSIVNEKIEFIPTPNDILAFPGCEGQRFTGSEKHTGRTKYLDNIQPLFTIVKRGEREVEINEGAISREGRVFGTYIHGIFNNEKFRKGFLENIRNK